MIKLATYQFTYLCKHKKRPTKRAPDAGDSAQISGGFLRLGIFCLDGVPPSAPAPVTQAVRHTSAQQKSQVRQRKFKREKYETKSYLFYYRNHFDGLFFKPFYYIN